MTVGHRCVTFAAAGARALSVPLTRRARQAFAALARARGSVTILANVRAGDAAGNQGAARGRLRLVA